MSLLGFPDLGLLSATEVIEQVRRIAAAVSIPLICDADTGYGNPLNVARTVRAIEATGSAGLQLEDQEFPKRCGHFEHKKVVAQREMVMKIRAACDTRRDRDFVIVARTDALSVLGVDTAIERALAYKDAGADVLFVESPHTIDELREIGRRLPGPLMVNVVEGGRTPHLDFNEYQALGFKLILYPTISIRVVARALESLLRHLQENRTSLGFPGGFVSFEERNEITDLATYQQMEERYAVPES